MQDRVSTIHVCVCAHKFYRRLTVFDMEAAEAMTQASAITASTKSVLTAKEKMQQERDLKYREGVIKDFVSKELWKGAKFIMNDEDLDFGGQICNIVFQKVCVDEEGRQAYWKQMRKVVKKALDNKRNNTCTQVKCVLIGK